MASSGFEPGERLSSGGYRYPDHYTIQLHLGYYQSYDLSRELARCYDKDLQTDFYLFYSVY